MYIEHAILFNNLYLLFLSVIKELVIYWIIHYWIIITSKNILDNYKIVTFVIYLVPLGEKWIMFYFGLLRLI